MSSRPGRAGAAVGGASSIRPPSVSSVMCCSWNGRVPIVTAVPAASPPDDCPARNDWICRRVSDQASTFPLCRSTTDPATAREWPAWRFWCRWWAGIRGRAARSRQGGVRATSWTSRLSTRSWWRGWRWTSYATGRPVAPPGVPPPCTPGGVCLRLGRCPDGPAPARRGLLDEAAQQAIAKFAGLLPPRLPRPGAGLPRIHPVQRRTGRRRREPAGHHRGAPVRPLPLPAEDIAPYVLDRVDRSPWPYQAELIVQDAAHRLVGRLPPNAVVGPITAHQQPRSAVPCSAFRGLPRHLAPGLATSKPTST
ncbi:hypothetical protein STENM36S_04959 [Streptomyces tendae]